ncbi:MAG: ATP-binding protein [Bacteroidota bacterium]
MKHSRIYFYATIISISVILLNQLFIQYWLYNKRADAEIINIGGRQRMYSQKLVALLYAHKANPESISQDEIQEFYDKWEVSHAYLIDKFQPIGLGSRFKDDIRQRLILLSANIEQAARFIGRANRLVTSELEGFRQNQDDFLGKMNTIVFDLERDAERKLTVVIVIEIVFAICSLLLVYYEITYIFKKINLDLQKKNSELVESNQLLEQYAYLAAHDLRSPTQNVINFSKLLYRGLTDRLKGSEKEYFHYVIDSAERLRDTTEDLLKFSSITHNRLKIEECEPIEIINRVMNDLKVTLNQKAAEIKIGELPGSIRADKSLIQLVFQNLIANGVKFVPDNTKPVINITYQSKKEEHFFEIQDNGIGISDQDKEKIFGLFKRLHNQEVYEGTGIGLSICQKVVEKHQGEIGVTSMPLEGSTFFFTIPKDLAT